MEIDTNKTDCNHNCPSAQCGDSVDTGGACVCTAGASAGDRSKSGIRAGLVGLALNLLLGAGKLAAGLVSGSVAIVSDAANNLSDSASSIVTVTSFALSRRKPDREHPHGHGRYEYIAGLIIGVLILVVGVEFVRTGIERIVNGANVQYGVVALVILCVSAAVKLFMTFFYLAIYKKINSDALKAAAADSLFDTVTTLVVLICFAIQKHLPFTIDGWCTVAVALVIVWGGIKVMLETIGKLLGSGAPSELSKKLYALIVDDCNIVGAHDLVLHDYGPNKIVGSAHAEFCRDMPISEAHRIIDRIESRARTEFGVELVVHVDLLDFSNPLLNEVRTLITAAISGYSGTTAHEIKLDDEQKLISLEIKPPEEVALTQKLQDDITTAITNALSSLPHQVAITFDVC